MLREGSTEEETFRLDTKGPPCGGGKQSISHLHTAQCPQCVPGTEEKREGPKHSVLVEKMKSLSERAGLSHQPWYANRRALDFIVCVMGTQ